MSLENKGKSFLEIEEDWIQELFLDSTDDIGLGERINDLPPSVLDICNQPNVSIAGTNATSSSSHILRNFSVQQSGFSRHKWQNQIVVQPSNSYQNQDSGFCQARNPTPVGQIHTGNQSQSQTMLLGGSFALPESIPTPAQISIDWVNEAYSKVMQKRFYLIHMNSAQLSGMKETILPEVLIFHRRAQEKIQLATTAEEISRYEGLRRTAERVIKFVRMSRAEMSRWPKEKLYKSMNRAIMYYDCVQTRNSISPVRLENVLQINNLARPSAPHYPRQQLTGIDSRALGSFLYSARENNRSPTNQANAKRMKGLWRKEEKTPTRFAGSQGLQMEWKDLPPPSHAPVSLSVSPSSFLSDFTKSPVSVESCRFAPSSSNSPLMNPTCSKPKPNPSDVGEQSTDPVKRLVNAVMFMSPRAFNSAIQDMYAIMSLSDRVATDFVNGGSMEIIQRDLSGDISKFGMQSAAKDKMESGMGFCVGSASRLKKESLEFLLHEIEEINQRSMELKVYEMNMDAVSRKGFDGDVLIRFSYTPVGPASQQMASKLLLELTVPPGYPNLLPAVSDEMLPSCCDFEGQNLWTEAKSCFSLKLRKLGEPMTVKQLAKAWEDSAREVFLGYAERLGGGSLLSSTRYGRWESMGVAF